MSEPAWITRLEERALDMTNPWDKDTRVAILMSVKAIRELRESLGLARDAMNGLARDDATCEYLYGEDGPATIAGNLLDRQEPPELEP